MVEPIVESTLGHEWARNLVFADNDTPRAKRHRRRSAVRRMAVQLDLVLVSFSRTITFLDSRRAPMASSVMSHSQGGRSHA